MLNGSWMRWVMMSLMRLVYAFPHSGGMFPFTFYFPSSFLSFLHMAVLKCDAYVRLVLLLATLLTPFIYPGKFMRP